MSEYLRNHFRTGKKNKDVRNHTESGTTISPKEKAQLDKAGSLSEWINQELLIEQAQKSNNSSKMLQDEASDEKNLICCAKVEPVKDCTCCCKKEHAKAISLGEKKELHKFFQHSRNLLNVPRAEFMTIKADYAWHSWKGIREDKTQNNLKGENTLLCVKNMPVLGPLESARCNKATGQIIRRDRNHVNKLLKGYEELSAKSMGRFSFFLEASRNRK